MCVCEELCGAEAKVCVVCCVWINIDADLCVVIFILKKVNRKEKKLPIIGVVRWGIGNLITTIY